MMSAMRPVVPALVLIAFIGATGFGFWKTHTLASANVAAAAASYKTPQEEDVNVRFVMEAYDLIQKNYWQKAGDDQLAGLFTLSIDKAASTTTPPASDRASTARLASSVLSGAKDDAAKRQLAVLIVQIAVYNLAPAGRSEVLTSQQQQQLQQTVSNVNPNTDLYGELGVTPSSTAQQIQQAYAEKKTQLEASTSPEAKDELARAGYVKDVLSNPADKERYDTSKEEPTVFSKVFGTTLYLNLVKMSPETGADFWKAIDDASTTPLSSMIIDLRGNIGGSLQQAPDILGPFFGQNAYIFDLYHQGDFTVIRSNAAKSSSLERFKEIAVLTDNMTQSTAEVLTASLKRFHLAKVVGTETRGWGTVEGTYPMTTQIDPGTQYALLLVYGLTLREDGQPIDGKGVDPDVNVNDKNWKQALGAQFESGSLIAAIERTQSQPPLK